MWNYGDTITDNTQLYLMTVRQVPLSEVSSYLKTKMNIFKNIKSGELKRYNRALDYLENNIAYDYNKRLKDYQAYEEQQRRDDLYIKEFKKKYGR